MYRLFFFAFTAAVALGLCAAGYFFGRNVAFGQQWPLYEALRNTASIIFAVVGAWLAIVYPERFKLSLGRPDGKAPTKASRSMGMLLLPAVHSTILLVLLLLVGVLAPLIKQLPFVLSHVEVFRGLSYAFVIGLTCWQIVIVVMTLFPAEALQTQAAKEQALEALDAQHGKLRAGR